MTTYGRSTVVGVFRTREKAKDAIDSLKDAGFSSQDIGILIQDKGETQGMAQETGTNAGTGAIGGGILGGRWEDYEPGYRYGYDMSSDPRYRGRAFSDAEPELRRDWETRHRDKPWDRFEDSIRDAWEGVTSRDRAA
ncbi:MAG TPA: general stress protein [Chloroflexota bacterium]|nr:general stress protein [Chloroflexota bacterium]